MQTKDKTKAIVILGLMTAMVMLFSFTPIGSIPVGPLVITLNVIPVAVTAIALGPKGGLIMGSIFGLMSFLQCFGIGVLSGMGATLVGISPVLAFIQRFVPRALDGFLVGLLHNALSKKIGGSASSFVTGFCTALFNTILFMGSLVLLFGNTDYVKGLFDAKGQQQTFTGTIVFICLFVGINAVSEMVVSTIVCGGVGTALYQSHVLPLKKSESKTGA